MAYQDNDIEKYIRGELTPAEMHALEQRALKDPFLAEALEGAAHAGPEIFSLDLHKLQRSIHDKSRRKQARTITLNGWGLYVGIAAGLLLLALSSFIIFIMIRQQESKEKQIAENKSAPAAINPEPKIEAFSTDSIQTKDPVESREDKQPSSSQLRPTPQLKPGGSETIASAKDSDKIIAEDEIRESEALQEPVSREIQSADTDDDLRSTAATQPSVHSGASDRKSGVISEKIITGKIVSPGDGSAIEGVNVLIKGTNKGTITNSEGKYELRLSENTEALVFSSIGRKSQEVNISGRNAADVKMETDPGQSSEVVIAAEAKSGGIHPLMEMAEPEGGTVAFRKYLEEQFEYPREALAAKIEGSVHVQFTVLSSGKPGEFKILEGPGFGCEEETIRLIREGPAWKAGSVPQTVRVMLKLVLPSQK